MESIVCTGCQNEVTTPYCSTCGQKIGRQKSSIVSLLSDFISNLFSLQNSIPATFLKLLTSPATVIDNYYNGFRGFYPSPGKMVIFASYIAALHFLLFGPELFGISLVMEESSSNNGYFVVLLLSIFLLALTSYITYLKTRTTFSKHLISTIYLWTLFFSIFLVLSGIATYFFPEDRPSEAFLLPQLVAIMVWNAIVFTRQKKFFRILGSFFSHVGVMIATIALLGVMLDLLNFLHFE